MEIRLGMSPISWSNDDLPQLGGDTPLEVCLRETRMAGFTGTETGGKFPKQPDALSAVLNEHDLSLVSGWYSGTLIHNDIASEIEQITPQLALFKEVGASVIVYGETYKTIQNKQSRPLSTRLKLSEFDVAEYDPDNPPLDPPLLIKLMAVYGCHWGISLAWNSIWKYIENYSLREPLNELKSNMA